MSASLLTIQDLAGRLGVTERTIRRWVARRRFPRPERLGTWVRWQAWEVTRWERRAKKCVRECPYAERCTVDTLSPCEQ